MYSHHLNIINYNEYLAVHISMFFIDIMYIYKHRVILYLQFYNLLCLIKYYKPQYSSEASFLTILFYGRCFFFTLNLPLLNVKGFPQCFAIITRASIDIFKA